MKNILIKAKLAAACWDYKEAPRDIEYFPEGEHTIQCSVNGKPQELTVKIDSSAAETMQKSLDDAFAQFDAGEASKPFLDFDHEGKRAAAYPRRFFWKDGLRLELEWTPAGRSAVECREYNYFSPQFLVDKDGKPAGVSFPGAIGALCNVPAFQTIEKISATKTTEGKPMADNNDNADNKPANGGNGDNPPAPQNNETEKLKKENESLKAKIAELEQKEKDAQDAAEAARKTAAAARRAGIEGKVDALISAGRLRAESRETVIAAALKSDDDGAALFATYPERISASGAPIATQPNGTTAAASDSTPVDGIAQAAAGFKKIME